jgi:acyl carrier protein
MDEIKKILQLLADKTISPEDGVAIFERWKSQGRDVRIHPAILNSINKKGSSETKLTKPKEPEAIVKEDNRNIEDILTDEVISVMASFTKIEPDQISLKVSLQNYGMDSVSAANITNYFANKYQISLTATLLMEVRNLEEYSQLLLSQFRDKISYYYREQKVADKPDLTPAPKEQSLVEGEGRDLDAMWAAVSKDIGKGEK